MDFSIQESAMLLKKNLMVESLLYVGAGAGENKPGAGQNPDRLSNTYPTYLNIWLELVRDHEGIPGEAANGQKRQKIPQNYQIADSNISAA